MVALIEPFKEPVVKAPKPSPSHAGPSASQAGAVACTDGLRSIFRKNNDNKGLHNQVSICVHIYIYIGLFLLMFIYTPILYRYILKFRSPSKALRRVCPQRRI